MDGPNTTPTFSALASFPISVPTASARSGSKEDASAHPAGKQTAVLLSFSPRWSVASVCFLRPLGPSVISMGGIPDSSSPHVCQKSLPAHNLAFSSIVIDCNLSFISLLYMIRLFSHPLTFMILPSVIPFSLKVSTRM